MDVRVIFCNGILVNNSVKGMDDAAAARAVPAWRRDAGRWVDAGPHVSDSRGRFWPGRAGGGMRWRGAGRHARGMPRVRAPGLDGPVSRVRVRVRVRVRPPACVFWFLPGPRFSFWLGSQACPLTVTGLPGKRKGVIASSRA